MLPVLCTIAPAVLATVYYFHLWKWPLRGFQFVLYAVIFAFLINGFVIGIAYLRGKGTMMPDYFFTNVAGTAKFCALALVIALALPHILHVMGSFTRKSSRPPDNGEKAAEEEV